MEIKKTILIFFMLTLSIQVVAQKTINYPTIDRITYSQYMKGSWKELIKTGKTALKNDVDFYYLQVRMGIAYYELKKYRKAIPYFEKSRKSNRTNELVNEYLYYSYLFSGRENDARKLTKELSAELKTKLGVKVNPIISAISLDFRTENFDDYQAKNITGGLLEQDVRNDYSYFSFGINHLIKNNQKFSWSYSRINIGTTVFDIDDLNDQVADNIDLDQNEFYFNYQNQLNYGLNLMIAANILNIGSTSSVTVASGGPGQGGGGMVTIDTRLATTEVVGFLALRKDLANVKIGLNTSISNIDNNMQIQPGIDFTWYPLSNTNIYLATNASYRLEKTNNQWNNEPIIKQAIGFRLLSFYFEPSITYGNIINYTEQNAFIINNDNDVISDRYEFLVYGSLVENRLNLFVKYQNYFKTNTYLLNGESNEISYQNQTITGGIKWSF